jgi:antitoxin component YwqK of YwqJK toxin-antitoxin module
MKSKLLILFLISIVNSSFSQEENDTLYLDKKWNVVTKEKAQYFRFIKHKDSLFHVTDYYLNGTVQMSGTYSSLKPKIREGEFIWYFQNGRLSENKMYKNNLISGFAIDYRENGNLRSTSTYLNGKLNGVKCWWKRNGTLDFTAPYSKGEYDFSDSATFYSDLLAISLMDTSQEMYTKEYIEKNVSTGYFDYYYSANIKEYFYRDSKEYRDYEYRFYRNRKLKCKIVSDYINDYSNYYYKNGNIKSEKIISNDKLNESFKTYYKNGNIKSKLIIENNKAIVNDKWNSNGVKTGV